MLISMIATSYPSHSVAASAFPSVTADLTFRVIAWHGDALKFESQSVVRRSKVGFWMWHPLPRKGYQPLPLPMRIEATLKVDQRVGFVPIGPGEAKPHNDP